MSNIRRCLAALPDACWFVGFAAVAFGVGMIFLPAGVLVAGVLLCLVGYVLGSAIDQPEAK